MLKHTMLLGLVAIAGGAGCASTDNLVPEMTGSYGLSVNLRPQKANEIVVRGDSGGHVATYAARAARIDQQNMRVRVAGRCDSSCTLYLGLPLDSVCLEPGAYFRFHKASGRSARTTAIATNYLMRSYPKWVRDWLSANGGLTTSLKTMDFNYASKFLPVCDRVA